MLLITYGTRPEWIKIKPIIDLLDLQNLSYKLLFTGQHNTLVKEKYDKKLVIITKGGNRLDSIFSSILGDDSIFDGIDRVMVQGDTASSFAIALAAFHRKIMVIHLEAGLRTYDNYNPYPEELYRKCISNIASIHFCPTSSNKLNLIRELTQGIIHVIGNTSIDSLLSYKDKIQSGGGCLITLHRRENNPIMGQWISAINYIAKINFNMKFTFIIHPNFNMNIFGTNNQPNIDFISPVSHEKMLEMIVKSDIIISDSGGLQEEASFFCKPIIVCRKTTERPESIGITSFMCQNPEYLEESFKSVMKERIRVVTCPYGDGYSAEKIVKILYDEK